MGGKAGANLSAFVAKLDVWREQTQGLTLREIIELVLEHSGLVEHYRADREGADRIENLEELVNAAESFVSLEGFGRDAEALEADVNVGLDDDSGEVMSPLAAFLTHAALEAGDNQAQEGQDAIQLMTVHASKGLEFDVVFITGLEEGLFPHENSMNDFDGLEEERRLMYVAITRARKRLYLSHSQTRMLHGQTRYNLRSRFFDELPEDTLKWITPKQAGFSQGYGAGAGFGSFNRGFNSTASGTPSVSASVASSLGLQASSPTGASVNLRLGMRVFHNKFGEGVVLTLEGTGDDARAQINFPRHGVKWLALSVAKLTPVA